MWSRRGGESRCLERKQEEQKNREKKKNHLGKKKREWDFLSLKYFARYNFSARCNGSCHGKKTAFFFALCKPFVAESNVITDAQVILRANKFYPVRRWNYYCYPLSALLFARTFVLTRATHFSFFINRVFRSWRSFPWKLLWINYTANLHRQVQFRNTRALSLSRDIAIRTRQNRGAAPRVTGHVIQA